MSMGLNLSLDRDDLETVQRSSAKLPLLRLSVLLVSWSAVWICLDCVDTET